MSRDEKWKIGISGSAENNCAPGAFAKAFQVGKAIARAGAITVTGDTRGIPYQAARGAKQAGGTTIGISPATSHREHVKKYRLPDQNMDLVMYTGFEYSGRNLLFIRACDAVVFICGRIGTLNEFTIAFEDKKPIGILTETGGIAEEIDHLLAVAKRGRRKVISDADPDRLVDRLLRIVKQDARL